MRPVLRDLRLDGAVLHVDATVESRALDDDDLVGAERAFDLRACGQLDPLAGRDAALQLAFDQHSDGAHIGSHRSARGDGRRALDLHLAIDAAFDDGVLAAEEFTGDDERRTDSGHKISLQ